MPNYILITFLWVCSVNSFFSSGFSIEKIKQGELLEKAKATTFEVFFEHWMDRNVKKATEGTWVSLYKNEEFLYFGWATFESLTSTTPSVKEFYKAPMADISEKFPNYEKVHGNSIREKLEEIISKFVAKPCEVTVTLGFKVTLDEDTLVIETPCSVKLESDPKSQKFNYYIVLDKNSLKLIEIEEI